MRYGDLGVKQVLLARCSRPSNTFQVAPPGVSQELGRGTRDDTIITDEEVEKKGPLP
jgi:hypothetical protein